MRPIDMRDLQYIGRELRLELVRMDGTVVRRMTETMVDYHGFGKFLFHSSFLSKFTSAQGLDLRQVQAELIKVDKNLKHEIHCHQDSDAFVLFLGEHEHLQNPKKAFAFCGWNGEQTWDPVDLENNMWEIPKGQYHGFTVEPGGILYFLSIQSPPISGHGNDDYHRL